MARATSLDHLCEPCRAARDRWLDYRISVPLSITYGSGAAYDSTPHGIADARRARFEHWRSTIRWHRQSIADHCLAGRHVPVEVPAE